MSDFESKLYELAAEYKGKADHYERAEDHYMSAVYWGCYTGVFYASCAYSRHRLEGIREEVPPFDDGTDTVRPA